MLFCLLLTPMVLPSTKDMGPYVSSVPILAWDNFSWEFHAKFSLSLLPSPVCPGLLSLWKRASIKAGLSGREGGEKGSLSPPNKENKEKELTRLQIAGLWERMVAILEVLG